MKKVLLIITAFIYLSCSYNYDRDIKKIEEILGIDLKQYEYEVKNKEHSFGFGEELVMFDIVFNEQDFKSFLKEIDLNKFDKVDFGHLGIKNSFDYSANFNDGDSKISLSINIIKRALYYSYFED